MYLYMIVFLLIGWSPPSPAASPKSSPSPASRGSPAPTSSPRASPPADTTTYHTDKKKLANDVTKNAEKCNDGRGVVSTINTALDQNLTSFGYDASEGRRHGSTERRKSESRSSEERSSPVSTKRRAPKHPSESKKVDTSDAANPKKVIS